MKSCVFVIYLVLLFSADIYAQSDKLLGITLRPEIKTIVSEIEKKTGQKIYAEFDRQEDYQLGSSSISETGVPVVLIDFSLENDPKKLEAVIAHELLHLRLRVNGYPTFIFSPTVKTAKGRAIDTEQSNINDLKDLIEHQIFKPEMKKLGLYEIIDLAGNVAVQAKKQAGKPDSQADAINYARAILEYQNAKDIEEVARIYTANGWNRSLKTGREIADIISQSNLQSSKDAEAVFLQCLLKLYPPPRPNYTFSLTPDRNTKVFRQMIVGTSVK